MEKQKNISQIIPSLIFALILFAGTGLFFWKAGFFNEKSKKPMCSIEYVYLCITENECLTDNLYWWDNSCHTNKEPGPKPSEYPDYEAYKLLSDKITLVNNNSSFVTKDYKKIGEVTEKLFETGTISRAYLFIDVSVDNGLPLTIYDSIYITLNYKGGHLFRSKSLPVPPSETTHLLYDLREIPYIKSIPYSENKSPIFADWLTELNLNKNVPFYTFLSTWREGGLIKEISIAFECEEDSNCNIESE